MCQLKEHSDSIITTLKNHQSTIMELDTPEIKLQRIEDVFEDSLDEKSDVIGCFSARQCGFIIDLGEQKWSWKTIMTSIGVIALVLLKSLLE